LNLNILWLNPVIPVCLAAIILKRPGTIWFRILFSISVLFILLHLVLPQDFNIAFFPLVLVLLVRSSIRAGFEWNPATLK
jgi:hypothetical protein